MNRATRLVLLYTGTRVPCDLRPLLAGSSLANSGTRRQLAVRYRPSGTRYLSPAGQHSISAVHKKTGKQSTANGEIV